MLPPLIKGEHRACFAVTEPNTGLNTQEAQDQGREARATSTSSRARRCGSPPRRSPRKSCCWHEPTAGLTLFYTDLDRKHIEVREIDKMGRHAVDSNQVFFDGLPVPEADRIGEEGKGFEYILHGMNPERILIAAELVGLGRCAVTRAAAYAKERIVFDRPIGQNQAIQHPLAANWAALEAANLMAFKAAWLYDSGQALRRRGERGEVPRRRGLLRRLPAGGDDARRLRLRQRVPRRALPARILRRPHRPGEPAPDPVLHRRAGARPAQVLLRGDGRARLALPGAAGLFPGGAPAHGVLPPRRPLGAGPRRALPLRRRRSHGTRLVPHRLGGVPLSPRRNQHPAVPAFDRAGARGALQVHAQPDVPRHGGHPPGRGRLPGLRSRRSS